MVVVVVVLNPLFSFLYCWSHAGRLEVVDSLLQMLLLPKLRASSSNLVEHWGQQVSCLF